jgi:hypothetical protein
LEALVLTGLLWVKEVFRTALVLNPLKVLLLNMGASVAAGLKKLAGLLVSGSESSGSESFGSESFGSELKGPELAGPDFDLTWRLFSKTEKGLWFGAFASIIEGGAGKRGPWPAAFW